MKSPLLIIGTLLVIALFTALIAPFFVDWAQYRSDIEEYGRQITGREVKIAGDIDIRILPLPKLTLGRVSIANHEGAQAPDLMSARRLDARLSLSPLLRGKLHVTSILLEEPVIDLERMENGTGNWWLKPHIDLVEFAKIEEISLEAVRLTNATFFLRDARRDSVARFDDGELTISAASLSGPTHVRGTLSYENDSIGLAINSGKKRPDGSMRLNVRLKPQTGMRLIYNFDGQLTGKATGEVARGKLRIAPPAVKDARKGDQLSVVERLPFEFTTQVKVFGESVALEKIDFALNKKNRITNAITGQAIVSLSHDIAARGQFETRRLDFDILKDSLGEGVAGDLKRVLSLETVDGIVKAMPGGFSAALSLKSDQLLSGGQTIEDAMITLDVSGERLKLETLEGVLPGRTNFKMSGLYLPDEKTPQFIGEIGLDALDGRSLLDWFRPGIYPQGKGNMGRLTMGGKLTATPERVRINDGQFSFDGGAGTGSLAWARSSPPLIDVSVEAKKLDLSTVLTGGDGLAGLPQFIGKLAGNDATVDLNVIGGSVVFGENTFSKVKTDVQFSPEALRIRQFSAGLEGEGTFELSGELTGFPEKMRGFLSGAVKARDGTVVEALLGKVSTPIHLRRLLAAGAVDLVGEFEAGVAESWMNVSGVVAGGTLNARLISQDGLSAWKRGDVMLEGGFETTDAGPLIGALGLTPPANAGFAKIKFEVGGSFEKSLETKVSGELLGAEIGAGSVLNASEGMIAGTGNFNLKSGDGSRFLHALGVKVAPGVPLSINAKLFARENILTKTAINADFSIAQSAGKLSGTLDGIGARQKLTGNVAVTNLDLPVVLGLIVLGDEGQSGNASTMDWPDRLFRENITGALDAELSVSADELRLIGEAQLAVASFIASIADGALEVSALTGKLGQGTFDGSFKLAPVRGGTRSFLTRINLQNADLSRWMISRSGDVLAKGKVNLNGTLKAVGRSPAGLMSVMSGAGNWEIESAQVAGIGVAGLRNGLKDDQKMRDIETFIASELMAGNFAFQPVSGEWGVEAGLLRIKPAQVTSQTASAKMSVFVDLPARKFDASWSVKLHGYDELPEFSVALAGPFNELQRSYDISALKSHLVVRGLKEGVDRLEELQAEQQRIYEEQKRLEDEEIARREADERRRREEEEARLKTEEDARLAAEKTQQETEEKARLVAAEEARQALEKELRRQEVEQRNQEELKAAKRAEEARRANERAERDSRKNAEEAAQKAAHEAEQPLPFDNSGSTGLPVIITPKKHGVIRKILPPTNRLDNR
jgi:uncharacterized protein involved in outer membrane biogenesis